jgi:endoglucanase
MGPGSVTRLSLALGLLGSAVLGVLTEPGLPAPDLAYRSPLHGLELYLNPENNAPRALAALRAAPDADPAVVDAVARIAAEPMATWFTDPASDPVPSVTALTTQAQRLGTVPVVVVYGVPERDCGLYSAGGAAGEREYLAWVAGITAGIGERAAIVVLEPDAVAHALDGCLSESAAQQRLALLSQAVTLLKQNSGTRVYLDAGNATWISDLDALGEALRASGVERADGFALNVSNYRSTGDSVAYGQALSRRLAGAHFVVDTSRNGQQVDPAEGWCNVRSARLGRPPTTSPRTPQLDAYLWVKQPGNSDGECGRGDPPAGQWWPESAVALASPPA